MLDADVVIADAELDALNDYDGASVTLVRNGGVTTEDVFSFSDGNGITLETSTSLNKTVLQKSGATIAIFDTTTIPGELRITFTNANGQTPTSTDVDNILQQITYANSSDAPPASAQIGWTFDDGNTGSQGTGGALQVTGSTTVTITAVNDAPNFDTASFTAHTITTGAASPFSVTTADVDGDGDLDVLSASQVDDKIAWYENDGNENFTAHTITTDADAANWVTTADLDGDGDLDVLSSSALDDKIAWYENDGNENFTAHTITTGTDRPFEVKTADVDGDGDMDVVTVSQQDNKIAWFENDGNENFTEHIITTAIDSAQSVDIADVDGDGDMDVLSASNNTNQITWYENDGSENFTAHIIDSTNIRPTSITTADVDGDGDLDVLSSGYLTDQITWYENDGNENFTVRIITNTADYATSVTTADVDGDGDLDVLSASRDDDKIAWYENTAVTTLDGTPTFIEDGAAVVLDADVDISDVELDALNSGNGDYHDASVTLVRNGGVSTEDIFSFSDGNGITLVGGTVLQKAGATIASFNITTTPGQLVITFTNANGQTPTSTDVDNILRQISYENSSDDPPATAQIDWSFDDGDASVPLQATGSTTVTITAVNDEPTLSGVTANDQTFTEGGTISTSNIFTGVTIDTIEAGQTILQADITLGGVQTGDTLSIDSQTVSNINADAGTTALGGASTHSYSISSGVLSIEFAAGTTEAQAQTVLNNIGFAISNSDDPDTTTRTFTGLTVQDSGGVLNSGDDTSAVSAVQTDITVVAVNDEPTLSGVTANDQTFTEGGTISTSNIFTGVTIDTIEAGQTILQADITLGGVQAGDTLTIDSQSVSNINADAGTTALGGASTHSYSISSGVLSIEFAAGTTEAQAQTVLNNIGFAIATSDDPDTTTRTFTGLTVQDSGGVLNSGDDTSAVSAVQTDITVVAVNDEPTLSGVTANDQTFTEGGTISTSNIFTGVTIDTIEAGQTILQADITLGGVQTGDTLSIDSQTVSNINADAGTTALGGASTHSYSISSGVLSIEFAAGTTEAQAQTVLNNIGFAISNSDDPDTTTRTFTGLTVQDSGGVLNSGDDTSAVSAVQTDITVVAVNDEPTLSGVTANDQTFTEGGTISTSNIFTGVTIDTIEAGQTILQADITLGGVQAGDTLTIDSQSVSNINVDAGTTALGGASTHSYSISSGVLSIEFAAGTTEAQAQTVLNNIGFAIATSDDPDTTTRTFTALTVQDSGGVLNSGDDTSAASAVQTDITVVGVNDTPTLAATPADDNLTENSDVTSGAVFPTVTIDPIETGDSISEAQVTLAGGLEDSDIINVNGTAITNLTTASATGAALASGGTYDYDHTTGVLTIHFAGSTSAAAAEAILEAITFGIDASDNDPSTIARTVTLNTVTDNGGGADTNADINETATISVGEVNDTPTLAATPADDNLTENSDVTSGAVFPTVTIDPIETGDSISEAQVTLAGGLEDSDIINVNGTAITNLTTASATGAALASGGTYDYDHTTGVLTIHFAGSTSAAAAEAILEAITFGIDASDNDPSTIARTVTLNTVTDNGGGADTNADINETATISVGEVNDTPTLAATPADDNLTENSDVTSGAVFPTVTIDPIETGDSISEAQVTLAGGLEDSDIINVNGTAITNLTTASATGAALASGGTYDYDHTTGVLTIHFAGSTSAAAAEAILEAITFGIDASDNDPSTIARTVTLNTVTDNGGGADTNADINETATISVTTGNDAPILTGDLSATVNEGATYIITGTDLGYTDPDDLDAGVTFTTSSATNGRIQVGGIDASTFTGTQLTAGQVTFIHDSSETVAAAFDVNVEDGNEDISAPVDSTFNFTVTPVNDAPVVDSASLTLNEGDTVTLSAANFGITDLDDTTFTYTVSSITGGYFQLSSNPGVSITTFNSAELSGTLLQFVDDGNEMAPAFSVTVNDGDVDSNTLAATINYTTGNDAPVLGAIGNQNIDELATLAFTATATDSDLPADTLTFSLDAASITAGMTIDANTGAFSWTPTESQGGSTPSVTITVTDDGTGNLIDSETFTITVAEVNTAPVLGAIGNQNVDELANLNFTATATDSDLPADNLTFSLDAASITAGMTIDANTGAFSWTPTESQGGSIPSVTISVTDDGTGNLVDSETFTITVAEINTAPVLGAIGNQNVDELATLNFTATATDSDLPADNLTFSLDAASITAGMSIDANTGAFSWTPTESQGGSTPSVTITVTDDGTGNLIDSETFTITVAEVNTAPVLGAIGNQSVDELATLSFTATATDSDLPADTLTFSLDAASITAGMTIDANTGAFSWTPTESQGGSTPSVTVTVTDDGTGNLVDSETFTITVAEINTAPVLGAIGNQTVDELATLNFTATATDSDLPADNLTFSLDAASITAGMTIDANTGAFSWTPTESQGGSTPSVTITVTDDGTGNLVDSETFTITVAEINTAPVLGAIGNQTVDELATLSFTATATDSDLPADTLTFSLDAASITAGMTIDANTGAFSWTPTESQGGSTPSVTITVTDDGTGNLVDSETFTITVAEVNTAPVLGAIGNQTVDELATLNFTATATDSDLPADNLTFSLDAASITAGMTIDANTGAFSWTPTESQGGLIPSVTITVTDDGTGNLIDSETFTITVADVNIAPVSVNDTNALDGAEDTTTATLNATLLANDSDPDGDSISITNINGTALTGGVQSITVTNGTVNIDSSDNITFTADADYNGAVSFDYTISDGALTNTATVSGTISAINDAATISGTDTGTVQEDISVVTNNISTTGTLTITDVDTGEAVFTPETITGTYGDLTIDAAGDWTYTADNTQATIQALDSGEFLTDTIQVSSADGTTHNVVMTINGSDDLAVIGGTTTGSVTEDGTLTSTGALTITDTDTSDPTNFVDVAVSASDNGYGTFEMTGNSWTYNLNNAHADVQALDVTETLTDTYTFTAPDGVTQQVTVTINGAEDTPVFDSAAITAATEDSAYTYSISTSDVDIEAVSITATTLPAWLSLTDNGDGTASLTGIPTNAEVGDHSVVLNVNDGEVSSNQSFTITVANTNDAPVANNDSASTFEDIAINNINILANDSDVDGDPIIVTSASAGNGIITINGDGTLNYIPDTNFNGTDIISYEIDDGNGGVDTGTLTLLVTSVNDIPVANADISTTNEDITLNNINVISNDTDVDGDILRVTGATADNGTITINPDSSLNYSPDANFNGTDTIYYDITDDNGGSVTGILSVFVTAINDAPSVTGINLGNIDEDSSIIITQETLLLGSSDTEGDSLSAINLTLSNGSGTLTDNQDGSWSFQPTADWNGPVSFNFDVSDGTDTIINTASLTVNPVNDSPVAINDSASTNEDTALNNINVLINDSDIDGDSLTVVTATASNGTVSINADSSLNYVPNADFIGSDTISYTLDDGNGATSTGEVSIIVNPASDSVDDALITSEDTAATINVLSNDTFGTGAALTAVTQGNNGSVSFIVDGTVTYTPNPDFNGTDSFTYTITTTAGDIETATVNVTISAVTDIVSDSISMDANSLSNLNVLQNDSFSSNASVDSITQPDNGQAIIESNGTVTYIPNSDFSGNDSFTYTVKTSAVKTETTTVHVTVIPAIQTTTVENTVVTLQPDNDTTPQNETPDLISPPETTEPVTEINSEEQTDTEENPADASTHLTDQIDSLVEDQLITKIGSSNNNVTEFISNDNQETSSFSINPNIQDVKTLDLARLQALNDQLSNQAKLSIYLDSEHEFDSEEEQRLFKQIDELNNQIISDELKGNEEAQIEAQVVLGSGISLTAGFVSWVLRSGSLLASLMSTVPLLNRFDPLPILKSKSNKDKAKTKDEDENGDSNTSETTDEVNELLKHISSEEKTPGKD